MKITDYLDVLQREYISYFLRYKIYPQPYSDRYKEYCRTKREKIEDVSKKSGSPNIFDDLMVRQLYIDKFIRPFGLPVFEYRDDKSRMIMGRWDKIYFYKEQETVHDHLGITYTVIVNMNYQDKLIVVDEKGVRKELPYINVNKDIISLLNF